MKTILVAGGAGFIGSHVAKMLAVQGYTPLIVDNLSSGNRQNVLHGHFIQADLANNEEMENIFKNHKIDAIMDFVV